MLSLFISSGKLPSPTRLPEEREIGISFPTGEVTPKISENPARSTSVSVSSRVSEGGAIGRVGGGPGLEGGTAGREGGSSGLNNHLILLRSVK